VLLFSTL